MKRRLLIPAFVMAGAVSFLPGWQKQDDKDREDFTIRSDVRLVLLDVSVKDSHGASVSGLTKSDFQVQEDGRPQTITVFAHDDVPVTIGIVVDESFSMQPKRREVLSAAEAFIKESNPHDEVFVLNFNDFVKPGLPEGVPFSADPSQLSSALARGVPEGRTALNDAVMAGLKHLEAGRQDKKALVLISDGGDNASHHTKKEMLERVERSLATIYTIGVYDENDPDRDPQILKKLARISGGDAYFPENAEGAIPVCRRVAHDIRARYTIGYIPRPGGALRHIRVHASAAGRGRLTAETRTSYRYDELQTESRD